MRLRLDFAYDGTDFAGWAPQPGRRTVYGDLSAALTTVLRQSHPVRLTVAGRTDAGVHAMAQVAHVDVPEVALATMPGRSDRAPEAALAHTVGSNRSQVVHAAEVRPKSFTKIELRMRALPQQEPTKALLS